MGATFKAANVSHEFRPTKALVAGDDGATSRPSCRIDLPSTDEIQAYFHSPDVLPPERLSEVERYIETHSVDDRQIRLEYLAQRERTERELAVELDGLLE